MFYDNLKNACEKQGLKISPIAVERGGTSASVSKWKNGAAPTSDIVVRFAMRLGVTTDYLLTGKEKSPFSELPEDKQRLLAYYDLMTDREQGELLGDMKNITKGRADEFLQDAS